MTNEDFLANFGHLANAPNGVERLRRLILDLAVRGRLVSQDPSDQPGSDLLARIAAEREQLIASKSIKKTKPFKAFSATELPFDTPAGWEFARLREVAVECGQKIPDQEFTYIDVSAVDSKSGLLVPSDLKVLAPDAAPSRARKCVEVGVVIYATVRPNLRKAVFLESLPSPTPIASTAFAVLKPLDQLHGRFLYFVMRSPLVLDYVEPLMRGVAYPALNDAQLAPIPVPIPPVAEQERIVKRVDELIALCDELEAEQGRAKDLRASTARSALATVVASDRSETDKAIDLLNEHLDLTLAPGDGATEIVTELRKTILDLAVRGRLVPQDPQDEPASELLAQITEDRESLLTKKARKHSVRAKLDEPFSLNAGWQWASIQDICVETQYGWTASAATSGSVKFVRTTDISSGKVHWETVPWCSENPPDVAKYELHAGDVLVSRAGSVGISCVIETPPPVPAVFASYLIRFPLVPGSVSASYLRTYFGSSLYWSFVRSESSGSALANLNATKIAGMLIPLPPGPEQLRIEQRVNELMALCDELEAALAGERELAAELAESAVMNLVAAAA